MENKATMGQVLPYARSVEYLRRLAVKQREQLKPVQALELLRLSLRKAPGDTKTLLELAETYAQIQCPSISNRILFSILDDDTLAADCLFGAGCNYFSLNMLDCARDCLVLALTKRPDATFAQKAVDIIEMIDSADDGQSIPEARINRRVDRVLTAMRSGKPALAARLARRALALEARNGSVHALLSFALNKNGDADGALEAARYACHCSHGDIRVLCAMAVALKAVKSDEAADAFLERAVQHIENRDDRLLVCHTACDMDAHTCVFAVLQRLEAESPLADDLLHLLAIAAYNLGEKEEAVRRWKLLRRINPMDSVADYYIQQAERHALPATLSYNRDVPLTETLNRLSRLREWVQEGADAFGTRWRDGDELERLLRWGLFSLEPNVPHAMLSILTTLGGERAQTVLRDVLPDCAIDGDLKHRALAALCLTGMNGPFFACLDGRLTQVHVSKADIDTPDPMLAALSQVVITRLGKVSSEEKKQVQLLCKAALRLARGTGFSHRARAVEMAFREMRGETPVLPARTSHIRKLARIVRRITKEAQHEMHQL